MIKHSVFAHLSSSDFFCRFYNLFMLPHPLLQRFGVFFPVVFMKGINTTKEILILFVYRAPNTFTARVQRFSHNTTKRNAGYF